LKGLSNHYHKNYFGYKNMLCCQTMYTSYFFPCSLHILTLLTLHTGLWMLWSTSETGTMMLYPLWPKV